MQKIHLGKLLLKDGLITKEQLDTVIAQQKITGERLGKILIDLQYVNMEKFLLFLSQQLNIPYINLKDYSLVPETVHCLPEFYARRFRAIVLEEEKDHFLVGLVDPQDAIAFDEVTRLLQRSIKIALVREDELVAAIDNMYRKTAVISAFAEGVSVVLDKNNFNLEQLGDGLTASDVPVVKLLQSMFENAVRMKASDIHIEPEEKVCRIRQRVDGVLHEKIIKEKQLTQALILRLKLMAGLNVSEKRLPQDGRFSLKVANKIFDIRLATLPVQFGESMVMRLLNQSANLVNLNQLGMADNVLSHLQKTLALSSGLLLVTGPTASGKTTTLYAALSELNSPSNKIITVEDPVEYRLPRINQVQVQPTIDFTFARALRSILRQDPNVIMIGELRDEETVEVALRAAMTGHLVLSTLHTNDVISGVLRLLDMKAEKYLIASVLRTVIAQRLLRQICSGCIQDITLTQQEKMWLETVAGSAYAALSFKQGAGCDHCHFTGYKGQIGIFELLDFTPVLAELLSANDIHSFSEAVKKQETFRPLVLCGLDLAARGMTSLSEVMRMSGESLHAERYHAESIPVYD